MKNMPSDHVTVRISVKNHEILRKIAEQEHQSIEELLERAVIEFERRHVNERAAAVWERKMSDPEERELWANEDRLLEGTLQDGLVDDEEWNR